MLMGGLFRAQTGNRPRFCPSLPWSVHLIVVFRIHIFTIQHAHLRTHARDTARHQAELGKLIVKNDIRMKPFIQKP